MTESRLIAAYFPFTRYNQSLLQLNILFDQLIFLCPTIDALKQENDFFRYHVPAIVRDKADNIKKYKDELFSWLFIHKGTPALDLAKAGINMENDKESKNKIISKLRDIEHDNDKNIKFSDINHILLLILAQELDNEINELGSYYSGLETMEKALDESLGTGLIDKEETVFRHDLITPLNPVEFMDYSLKSRIKAWIELWNNEPLEDISFFLTDNEAVIKEITTQEKEEISQAKELPCPVIDININSLTPVEPVREKLLDIAHGQMVEAVKNNNMNPKEDSGLRLRVYPGGIFSKAWKDQSKCLCLITCD